MRQDVKQILVGSLLGDGCLRNLGFRAKNTSFVEIHSIKQKDYLLWKKKILSKNFEFGNDIFKPKSTEKIEGRIVNFRKRIMIATKTNVLLTKLRRQFYPKNKKIITRGILDQLNPLGLAVWYCDDGSYGNTNNIIRFSTDAFGHKEHLIIQKYFKEKWNIKAKIAFIKKRKSYRFDFNRENTDKFLRLIKPAFIKYKIPKCMWYKLGHSWEGNTKKLKKILEKRQKKMRKYSRTSRAKMLNRIRCRKRNKQPQFRMYRHKLYKKTYAFRKKHNICYRCGKPKQSERYVLCKKCRKKDKIRHRQKR